MPDPIIATADVQRARRAARARGWYVQKSRDRMLHGNNKGMLRLLDGTNTLIIGWDFDASPQDIIDRCKR